MGIGLGILLLVLGLILLFAIKEFPDSIQEVVDPTTVGWILVIAGVLALVLGLVMNNQRSRTTHVEERRDLDEESRRQSSSAARGSEPAAVLRDPGRLAAGGGAGLADRRGQVVADRALREVHARGDRGHR